MACCSKMCTSQVVSAERSPTTRNCSPCESTSVSLKRLAAAAGARVSLLLSQCQHGACVGCRAARTMPKHRMPIRQPLTYWQVGDDRGQRFPAGYFERNRTGKQQLLCASAFGTGQCPEPHRAGAPHARSNGLLYFATFGRLTNCLLVLGLARWLAEQLGKTLVVPLCASAENTEQSCSSSANRLSDHMERNLLINVTAVYERWSVGGCQEPRIGTDLRTALGTPKVPRSLTCVGRSVYGCSWMLATNYQFVGLTLGRFVEWDLGATIAAWLRYTTRQGSSPEHLSSKALRKALRRQDDGEKCTSYQLFGCCGANESVAGAQLLPQRGAVGGSCAKDPLLPPCLRDCRGLSVFDATAGDVFVPNLFDHGGFTDSQRHQQCRPLTLSKRAAAQAEALRAALPGRFVCVHWRAGDFLSTVPLVRLRSQSMSQRNGALNSSTFMAAVAARAAAAVGVAHVLVLTNAKWARAKAFEHALLSHGFNATVRLCTSAPPDSEKEVCAKGAEALLLSRASSFSTHIHRMAPKGVPVEYLGGCPERRSSMWKSPRLLQGAAIPCQ